MSTDYKQYNYSGYTYCNGPFASQACGPCSVADLLDISPLTVAKWMTDNGYSTDKHGTEWEGISAALTAFGAGGKMLATNMDYKTSASVFDEWQCVIQSGYMGVLLMHNCTSNYWTNGGHYIAVVGYKDGEYLIYDPASSVRTGYHPWSDFVGNVSALYTSTKRWGSGASSNTTYSFTVTQIKVGSTGKKVTLLQKLLCSRGMYPKKEIDGSFGPKTEAAVKKYQKWISTHGGKLAVDGICGPATWESILGISGSPKIVKQVKAGDNSISVFVAQQILTADGYYLGDLDKNFGPATQAAVLAFQKKKKIAQDGVCGPTTWKKLIGF